MLFLPHRAEATKYKVLAMKARRLGVTQAQVEFIKWREAEKGLKEFPNLAKEKQGV